MKAEDLYFKIKSKYDQNNNCKYHKKGNEKSFTTYLIIYVLRSIYNILSVCRFEFTKILKEFWRLVMARTLKS